MKVPKVKCNWIDKTKDILSDVSFTISPYRMDDILEELGAERKGTKIDTIVDGLTKCADPTLAQQYLGQKILVSTSPESLYITSLAPQVFRDVQLPPNLEASISGSTDNRIGFGAKIFFLKLAPFLKNKFSFGNDEIFVFEVTNKLQPMEVAESLFSNGEGKDPKTIDLDVTFGFQKKVD